VNMRVRLGMLGLDVQRSGGVSDWGCNISRQIVPKWFNKCPITPINKQLMLTSPGVYPAICPALTPIALESHATLPSPIQQ